MKTIERLGKKIKKALFPDFGTVTIYAIIFLRVIATCLITNTHYNNVYPSEKFAVGGLLGDVLFFVISGFCYSNGIQKNFGTWYAQRWKRIYPSVLVMILIFYLTGFWMIPEKIIGDLSIFDICSYFILPTNFMFFGAIMLLYIPMFFCVNQKNGLLIWSIIWITLYSVFYVFIFDKSTYGMNDVSNPSVLFLYFGAILLGIVAGKYRNAISSFNWIISLVLVIATGFLYYWLTIKVRSNENLFPFQIIIPISILILCFSIILFFLGIEKYLKHFPRPLILIFRFISNLTLEIYVVQLIIIKYLCQIVFPLNWFLITFLIIVAAVILKLFVTALISCPAFLRERISNKKSSIDNKDVG